jgi:hypothetical protein
MPLAFQSWAWTDSGLFERAVAVWFGFKEWFLIDLDRYVLAFALAAVGFGFFLWLELAGVVDLERSTTPMLYLFSALAGGNITLITIVISINQLILSRELRSPRELQTEMHAAEEFRDEVEAETESLVVPEEPAEFLRVLVTDTRKRVERLGDAEHDVGVDTAAVDLDSLVSVLGGELDETTRRLERTETGVFPALSTILDVDFATRLNHTRWIARAYEDSIPDETRESLEDLQQHLEQLDVARQYFKTVYIKQELADVSKLVMSTGIAAVLVAMVFIVLTGYRTTELPFWGNTLVIPLGVFVTLVPLTLLISHVLRISAVARRTAAITPFLAPTE